jgi:hypothetical protein
MPLRLLHKTPRWGCLRQQDLSLVIEVRRPRGGAPIGSLHRGYIRVSPPASGTFLRKLTLLNVPLALAGERDLGEIELFLKDQEGVRADALLTA